MSRLENVRPVRTRPCEVPPARPLAGRVEEELSEEAVHALEEGREDHVAGRTFTMAAIKRELGIDS